MKLQIMQRDVKNDFPILQKKIHGKPLAYLDNAASSLTPEQVLEAMHQYYREFRSNVHRGVYQFSELATEKYEEAHAIVAEFIHAHPGEIIFTRNTTESLNLLASCLTRNLQAGDEIVLTELEHHSNLVPWQLAAKEKQLVVKYIRIAEDGIPDVQHAASIITPKTKIVSLVHMSNLLGSISPVKEIAALAHQHDALCMVDAAQSISHMPIDVQGLDCDFLAFSGHKMFGPTGIGVLYGKKHLLAHLQPFLTGGGTVAEVTYEQTKFREPPARFEAGTPAIAEAIGLAAAIRYLQHLDMQRVQEYTAALTEYALQQLSAVKGIEIYGPRNTGERGPLISFNLQGIHAHDVAAILDKEGVCIRAGHMCVMPFVQQRLQQQSVCRASFHIYNTKEDVDQLIAALHKAREVFNHG